MVKVLLIARLIPQSGNLTTAERIKFHLIESGNICDLQNTEFFENVEDLRNYIAENEICCVVGIHLWRAGKLLLDCPVPYSIIFGGTDLNQHVEESKKFHVMTHVAEHARILVAFSQTMACKAEEFWPDIKSKLIIQPQAVLTYPSQNFTEIDMISKLKECTEKCQLKKIVHDSLIIFLLVAGLRPVKDPMFLFKVFSDWHKEDPKVFLIVVGPEINLAFSEKVKDSAKKYPGVVVMPALSQSDLHAAIKHCAVAVVNTSISEGMASSILEAMDLDTAVIARKIPGNECLINHEENGLLFETPQEFLSMAKQVAYDEKYREQITLGGKEYVSNNHSLSLERETYSSVVKTLMS